MEAPKGRYSVVEKDGRLVVIDNESGEPASSSMPPPRAGGPGASPPPFMAAGEGALDGIAAFLVTLAVQDWDREGRAVVRWKWQGRNGREFRWDAALDKAQQRRLGRGLLALSAAPLFVLILIVFGLGVLTLPGLALTGLPLVWGAWTIRRLMAETGAPLDGLG